MDGSNFQFISCEQLRAEFAKCPNEINKRILIIDVRNAALYDRSHLCLDSRNNISSIKTKMRVMNIDPDLVNVCTSKKMMSILNPDDLKVFKKRKDATDVIIIDSDTDNISQLSDLKSKVMRLINGLTKFDNQQEEKIVVPIHVLEGGFKQWLMMYPHFTTDSTFNPDSRVSDFESSPFKPQDNHIAQPTITLSHPTSSPTNSDELIGVIMNSPLSPSRPELPSSQVQQPPKPRPILKPLPVPPTREATPSAANPNVVKNAPGTAVPVTPVLSLSSALLRSHSSPNVAQAEGDAFKILKKELPQAIDIQICDVLDKMDLTNNVASLTGLNSNHMPTSDPSRIKPRFDRTQKPTFNNHFLNAIKAQINFGRCVEASGKTITGLQNLGNTCFMNSVIQCLAYAPKLKLYFCSEEYYKHINFDSQYGTKGELAVEFGALVEKLNAHSHRYIEPKSFREAIIKHIGFAGNQQQDSHEFMMMLFDKMHHDLNIHAKVNKYKQNGIISNHGNSNNDDSNINIPRATLANQFWKKHSEMNKSIISDLFEGIFMSTLTCTFCKGQSNTFEVFNCLSLPISSKTRCHVRDCLSHFSNPERIEAAWECPRCKQKREADKKIVICKLPDVLIIHLKRFSLDGMWRQKLETTVDFPLCDLSVDYTKVLPQSAYGSKPPVGIYNLCAVVNHYGTMDGGHYTAFCKLENQRWYTFDDSNVSEMKDTDVCGNPAYILFYLLVR